jgi:DNA-binding NarL/FixJ family response regulator
MKKVRVILASDQTLVGAAIRSFLENCHAVEVLATVQIGPKARKMIAQNKPDLLFLHLAMRGYEGLEKAGRFLKGFPKLPNILLTVNNSVEYLAKALQIGAKSILSQTARPDEFNRALRAAMRGNLYISPRLPQPHAENMAFEKLTPRQRSVLKLMAEGKSTKEIARALGLSAKTVEFHRARLMERLRIYDVASLVRLAARVGLVSIDC